MALVLLVLAQAACLLVLAATAWAAGWAAWGRRAPERLFHPLTATIGLALLGSVGLLLALFHVFGVAALVAVAVAAHAAALPGWRLLLATATRSIRRAPGRALLVVLVVTAAASGGFVIGLFPPTAFDETTYHLSFARAFLAGGGLPWVPELRVPTFPVLGEALQAALLLGWGERGPHLVALLATLLIAGLLLAWGREAESSETGWLAAALFLGSPLVAYLAGTGYVDPLVGLFATGAFYALWRDGEGGDDRGWPALAGVLAGTAAAVKYLGLYAVLVGGLVMMLRPLLRRPVRWRALLAFATGVVATMAIPYGHLIWRTGNPLFPFFSGIFGSSGWEPPPALAAVYRHSIVLLPYNAVFRRELAGEQPPLSPALLLGLVLLAVAAVAVPRLRFGALVVAGFFAAYLAMPVVSRYLLTVLPLWCLLVAIAFAWAWRRARGTPPSRRAAALLALGLALPGPAYGAFYLAQRGAVPTSAQARVDYLAAAHPGYRALHWLQRRQGPRYVARCAGCEHLHGLAAGRLLGEHSGPWAYQRLAPVLDDPPALQRLLRADGVQYLLLPRADAVPLRRPTARGRFALVYADSEYEVWRVAP
jgi:4-amino-4-deoxy-L-arabinose transferase-like glycosyltransferase